MTDTPDIVERLRDSAKLPLCPFDRRSPLYWVTGNDKPCAICGGLPEGPDMCRGADTRIMDEAADEITRLRAQPLAAYPDYLAAGAQPAPLTRDEGGAVEEWVMVPREPTEAMNAAGYGNGRNARPIYRAMIAAAPKAPQGVAALVAEAEALLDLHRRYPEDRDVAGGNFRALSLDMVDRLAAALTPRELTDEEAERGARAHWSAICPPSMSWGDLSEQGQQARIATFRAAYRAAHTVG